MPKLKEYPKDFNARQRGTYDTLTDDYYEEMRQIYGTVMHQEDFMKYHRCGKTVAIRELKEVPYQIAGKYKKYRTLDVARMLAKKQIGMSIKGFEDSENSGISVPSLILTWFESTCKRLKMNKTEASQACEFLTKFIEKTY